MVLDSRKALVKFAYKDSATRAVNTVQQRKTDEFSLKYADKETIKVYCDRDVENDIVSKTR